MAENENENVFIKCVDCKQRSKLTKWSPWCLSLSLSVSPISLTLSTPGLIPVSLSLSVSYLSHS